MAQCKAYGCVNNKRRNKDKHYFCVPKPTTEAKKALARKWLHNIGTGHSVKTFNFGRNSVVCEDHFEPSCYQEDLKARLLGYPPRKRLREDAVPTIFRHAPRREDSGRRDRLVKRNDRKYVQSVLQPADRQQPENTGAAAAAAASPQDQLSGRVAGSGIWTTGYPKTVPQGFSEIEEIMFLEPYDQVVIVRSGKGTIAVDHSCLGKNLTSTDASIKMKRQSENLEPVCCTRMGKFSAD